MQTRRSDILPLICSGTASNRSSTSRRKTTRTLTRTTRTTRRMFPTTMTTTRTRARTVTLRRKESRACPSSPASRLGGVELRQRVDRALDARLFNHDPVLGGFPWKRIIKGPHPETWEKSAGKRDGPGRGRYCPAPLDFFLRRESEIPRILGQLYTASTSLEVREREKFRFVDQSTALSASCCSHQIAPRLVRRAPELR